MATYPASQYPLVLATGADFEKTWVYYPLGVDDDPQDWSGYTGKAQLRKTARAADALLEFTVTLSADGTVRLNANHSQTADLEEGVAVWDLYITDPEGITDRFMAGPAKISGRVTR